MHKVLYLLLVSFMISSCGGGSSEKPLKQSSGRINDVKVVVTKEQWEGEVGEALREVLAAPVDGLPQEEPMFSINQIPPQAFTGFLKQNRIFIRVQKDSLPSFEVVKNKYAKPQTGVIVKGMTVDTVVSLIKTNASKIVNAFKAQELEENQRRIKLSLKSQDSLKAQLGISLRFPTAYRYAKQEENFFWMRKNLRSGDMNIIAYEVPLFTLDRDTNTIARIVRLRDSIGGKNIPVDDGRFITERAFSPYLNKTTIDGHMAWETKGTWEVEGRYMAGPFLNYAIRDEANDRYVILEGFIFSPSVAKRDNMFELEAILRSANFVSPKETSIE